MQKAAPVRGSAAALYPTRNQQLGPWFLEFGCKCSCSRAARLVMAHFFAAEHARRHVARHPRGVASCGRNQRASAAGVQKPSNRVISLRFSPFRRVFLP